MTLVFTLLSIQALLGAFDNFWHHELHAALPSRPSARRELALHAWREACYACLFLALAWWRWQGAWALLPAAVLAAEAVITIADFLEEDRSRRLPPLERGLHTVLTIGYGVIVAVLARLFAGWFAAPTGVVPEPHGAWSALFTSCAVAVALWGLRNALAVRALGRRPEAVDVPRGVSASNRVDAIPETVLVSGATGLVGRALVAALRADGRRVIAWSRDARAARDVLGRDTWVVERLDELPPETRVDAIVHLAGARIVGMPWTAARRRVLVESRAGLARELLALARRLQRPPRVLVAASAVGFYGSRPVDDLAPLDESATPRLHEFASQLCLAAEHEARRAEGLGLRVVPLRFGVVLGREGGLYPMQALTARLGLGAVLGDGAQGLPWIHLDDAVGLVRHALDDAALRGPVNAVAPEPVTQRGFADALAGSFGRVVRLRAPAAPLRWLMGEQSTILFDGQHVAPRAALASGYVFRFPRLVDALRDLAGARADAAARETDPFAGAWPLTLYVDGACPLCRGEVDALRVRDHDDRLRFVDVREPGFVAPAGRELADMLLVMHARRADGTWLRGVESFRHAYAAVGLGWLVAPTGWPVLGPLSDRAYAAFARNRYRLPAWSVRVGVALTGCLMHAAARRAAARPRCAEGAACGLDDGPVQH